MAQSEYRFTVTQDEDGALIAQCVEIPGVITDAETIDQLGKNAIEALEAVLESRALNSGRRLKPAAPRLTYKLDLTVSGATTFA